MPASLFTAAHAQLVDALVAMRKRAGLTQRQLAARLGREQNYVGRIETRQRRVDLVELIQICAACGSDPRASIADIVDRVAGSVPRRRARR
jgi:transcriptional regulator with XRE-family HTH domain